MIDHGPKIKHISEENFRNFTRARNLNRTGGGRKILPLPVFISLGTSSDAKIEKAIKNRIEHFHSEITESFTTYSVDIKDPNTAILDRNLRNIIKRKLHRMLGIIFDLINLPSEKNNGQFRNTCLYSLYMDTETIYRALNQKSLIEYLKYQFKDVFTYLRRFKEEQEEM